MSPAHVLEPTYDALRRRLLAGVWPSGHKLEAARLADEIGVSMTPVRDSLSRLTGERLVQWSPGEGFQVPRLDETELCALIDWHHALIGLALRWNGASDRPTIVPDGHDGLAERTMNLFTAIGLMADNAELEMAIGNAAARLTPYRHREDDVLADAAGELEEIEKTLHVNNRGKLLGLIERYHHRRRNAAGRLAHTARFGQTTPRA